MRQCEYCGLELRAKSRFCGHCGKKVSSKSKVTTNVDDAPIVNIAESPLGTTAALSELQESAPENDVEEEGQPAPLLLENDVEEEEQTPPLVLENDVEEAQQIPQLALEDDVEEEQTEHPESSSAAPGDLDAEPEVPVNESPSFGETAGDHNGPPSHSSPPSSLREGISPGTMESPVSQLLDEQPELDQTSLGQLTAIGQGVSDPGEKIRSSSVRKVLLILLTVLIIAAGCAAALIGLFRWRLEGTNGSTNTPSSSSSSDAVNTSGSPLSGSVCASSSTSVTPGTSGGIDLTLPTTTGCSTFISATATSLCLIFPSDPGASHEYILNVSNVTVDNKSYHLVLAITEYAGSASYNDGDHVTVGIGEGSTGKNFSWLYRSGNITINSDEQTGRMDVILASASSGNTIHVVGGWTCGRLIKNK